MKQTLEDAFWQPGYFLATTGQVSIDVLMDYVETQSHDGDNPKTLEATLAPPTAHKERKLCDLLDTYRAGLHDAFKAGCETMSATSDVVTPYDLPYQAKAGLSDILPRLTSWGCTATDRVHDGEVSPLASVGGVVGRASAPPDRDSGLHLPPRGVRIRTPDSASQPTNAERINVSPAVGFIPRLTSWAFASNTCNDVPQLHGTYDAQELDDEHPVRLTNQAAKFDHSPERDYEFTWWVPHPGRGTNFWIPLRSNPAQEDLWHVLIDDDSESSAGQLRLQRHRTSWTLHVTVEFPVEEPDYERSDDDVTPVGFAIGEAHLLAGCACERGTPTDPLLINGGRARHLRKEMYTTLRRLQERDAAKWRIDERFDHYQNALTDIIEKSSRQAIEYACRFEKPVIVLENLSDIRDDLDYGEWMNRRLHAWAFGHLQQRIEDKARETGIPVEYVEASYTSQTCHECGHVGYRDSDEFRCQNDECWVSEYHADINAAVTIADRHDPWGESLPLTPTGDEISRDGSACDSATTPTEQSHPRQMTLGAVGSEPTASR